MAEYNGKEGVWRTVGGRRIFIEDGEDLATAMKKSGKFKTSNSSSIKDMIESFQPKDNKYMKFGYNIKKDEINLYAKGKRSINDLDDDDLDIDDFAITKIENWAKKIKVQIKKDQVVDNYKEVAKLIQSEIDSDWYSGMSFFGGDAPFTYNGFKFNIYLD